MNIWNKYKINIPEGKSGDWEVKKFLISEQEAKFDQLRAAINPHRQNRAVIAGNYTKLTYQNQIIMTDTPAEISDLKPLFRNACGNVLLNGLGLGVALQGILLNSRVNHVWINEISGDVINLVGNHYLSLFPEKITIQQADAFTWKPNGSKFNVVWHDIWSNICGDNYESMKKLHRKYGRLTEWQDSWCRDQVRR